MFIEYSLFQEERLKASQALVDDFNEVGQVINHRMDIFMILCSQIGYNIAFILIHRHFLSDVRKK